MPRPRKSQPKAVILPPEYDDIDEDTGSVMPDDDGWVTLEGTHETVADGGSNPVDGKNSAGEKLAGGSARRRQGRPRRDT